MAFPPEPFYPSSQNIGLALGLFEGSEPFHLVLTSEDGLYYLLDTLHSLFIDRAAQGAGNNQTLTLTIEETSDNRFVVCVRPQGGTGCFQYGHFENPSRETLKALGKAVGFTLVGLPKGTELRGFNPLW